MSNSNGNSQENQAHIVIVENDGMQPPSQYYPRRHQLGFRVRKGEKNDQGEYDVTPIVRRMGDEAGGVIVQEGCVLTPSYSQAVTFANLARSFGIEHVYIGRANVKPYVPTHEDNKALERLNDVFGRVGRPPAKRMWVITCLEELQVYYTYDTDAVVCPGCRATNIVSRAGEPMCLTADEAEATVRWMRTRFASGRFEIPMAEKDLAEWDADKYNGIEVECQEAPEVDKISIENESEGKLAQALVANEIAQAVETITSDPDEQIAILDAMFISRTYTPREARDKLRQEAFIKWVRSGGDATKFRLDEPDNPDLIDVASNLGVDYAVSLHRIYTNK